MSADQTYCSPRLGTITHEQFQAALDRMDLGRLTGVTAITTGNFGQNVFLSTDRGEYVLRGRPHYPWQFVKERFFARALARSTDVAVPWPYRVDYDATLFGWPYVIMPRMPGIQLTDDLTGCGLAAADAQAIAAQLGATLRRLQNLTHWCCGEYDVFLDEVVPLPAGHADTQCARVASLVQAAGDTLRADDRNWIDTLCTAARPALSAVFTPVFVMQDFKAGNSVASRRNGTWTISGVFDFMEPLFAAPEMDFPRQLCCFLDAGDEQSAVAFVAGYFGATASPVATSAPATSAPAASAAAAQRLAVYTIIDRLVIWNFGWRDGNPWWDTALSFREWVSLPRVLAVYHAGRPIGCAASADHRVDGADPRPT